MNDLGSCVGAYRGLTRLRVGVLTSVLALLVGGACAVAAPALPAAAATAGFVQQASAHGAGASLAGTTGANVTRGNRLVVEVGTWSSAGATASAVNDSLGDAFVEVTHFTAADGTEMSIWTAPVPSGGADTITVKPSSSAAIGVATLEYSGLSTVAGVTAVDQVAHSVGTTTTAGTVQSPATSPTTAPGELAIGFYADSGFGDTLAAGSGYTARASVSPTSDMEFLAEDQSLSAAGATPAASAGTGAKTDWLMA